MDEPATHANRRVLDASVSDNSVGFAMWLNWQGVVSFQRD